MRQLLLLLVATIAANAAAEALDKTAGTSSLSNNGLMMVCVPLARKEELLTVAPRKVTPFTTAAPQGDGTVWPLFRKFEITYKKGGRLSRKSILFRCSAALP